MLVSIRTTDLTDYVQESTYIVNEEDVYEEWLDGNYAKHRIKVRTKIKGSFEVALFGMNGITAERFINIWETGVSNSIVSVGLWIMNKSKFRLAECYYSITGTRRRELSDGNVLEILTIEVEEK